MNGQSLERRPEHPPGVEAEVGGYHLSSHDLRRGLEILSLPLSTVGPELLDELVRMRRSWSGDPAPDDH